jgi:hypothetical protein
MHASLVHPFENYIMCICMSHDLSRACGEEGTAPREGEWEGRANVKVIQRGVPRCFPLRAINKQAQSVPSFGIPLHIVLRIALGIVKALCTEYNAGLYVIANVIGYYSF